MSRRFTSLRHAPAETRIRLRDRLRRFLPAQYQANVIRRDGLLKLHDESLLELLLHLDISFASDETAARSAYDAALPHYSEEPDFDTLIHNGWLRIIWGRIRTSFEVSRAAQTAEAGSLSALNALLKGRFEERCHVSDGASKNPDLSHIVESINRQETKPDAIACEWPEWIAARVWDRASKDPTDMNAALHLWVDRWHVLGSPFLVPSAAWSESDLLAFWNAAMDLIGSKAGLLGWENLRANFIARMALIGGQSSAYLSNHVPAIPETLIGRSLWLEDLRLHRLTMDVIQECREVFDVVALLLTDIEHANRSSAPHPRAAELFAIAAERPELLVVLLYRLRTTPALLADILLNPATSALGCLIIGDWRLPGGAWDRELTGQDDRAAKATAFADAASVMGWFLRQGSLSPAEVAALLKWLYAKAGLEFIENWAAAEPMLPVVRAELVGQSPETLLAIVAALVADMPASGLGTPEFAAAVDIINLGRLTGTVDAGPIIEAYLQSLDSCKYGLAANMISVGGAATLFELAASDPTRHDTFMHPIDIEARLADEREENPFTREDILCHALRAHVRVLSRALAGSPEPSDDLVEALIAAVRSAALKHTETNYIPAFAPRYESNGLGVPSDRPIGADLGGALAALDDDRRGRLLNAILETDEPLVLAQLAIHAPRQLRARIRARAEEISPADAGGTRALTEAQTRIEALLSAGFVQGATRFIENEEELKTLGHVPGRALARFRSRLRLLFLQGDWRGIISTTVPEEFAPPDKTAATEALDFFRAIATLHDPKGDREGAEQLLARLHNRRPDVAGYAINLFAARMSQLLTGNLFGELIGADLVRGRQVLLDAEDMMRRARAVKADESAIFDINKAVMLLALREPQKAMELLARLRTTRLDDAIAAYTSVALARTGHRAEAIATVDQAEAELGASEILSAARAHIQVNSPFVAVPNTTLEDDPMPRIKQALWDLSRMDHVRQAKAFGAPPDALFSFVLDQVRFAAASLKSLVPMLGTHRAPREDDLNSAIRELLGARLHFLNWTVPDQSLGGYTAAGNPGERDLVLKRDSAELAVIEAVICEQSITHENLALHFKKLFAYSQCRLFFHLTYAYLDSRTPELMQALQRIAQNEAPQPFVHCDIQNIPSTDSRPAGFVARYAVGADEARVIFLVLDMGQNAQRQVAAALAARDHRNKSA